MAPFRILIIALLFPFSIQAQHTFSIVAVDSTTGEIGSAGATCGDSIVWPSTKGAVIISDVLPGLGAIHTQALYKVENQNNANARMKAGSSPDDIIAYLKSNDVDGNPEVRQYGVVTYNNGSPQSAGFTGSNCSDYKNHVLGANYAIQGNILLGQEILDSMEARFNRTNSCLADKLMAAMQGANVIGADTRCRVEGTSSLSAFLRLAKPDNKADSLHIDIVIAGTDFGVEPIDELQKRFDSWKDNNSSECSPTNSIFKQAVNGAQSFLSPNPSTGQIFWSDEIAQVQSLQCYSSTGRLLFEVNIEAGQQGLNLAEYGLKPGFYNLELRMTHGELLRQKFVLQSE